MLLHSWCFLNFLHNISNKDDSVLWNSVCSYSIGLLLYCIKYWQTVICSSRSLSWGNQGSIGIQIWFGDKTNITSDQLHQIKIPIPSPVVIDGIWYLIQSYLHHDQFSCVFEYNFCTCVTMTMITCYRIIQM